MGYLLTHNSSTSDTGAEPEMDACIILLVAMHARTPCDRELTQWHRIPILLANVYPKTSAVTRTIPFPTCQPNMKVSTVKTHTSLLTLHHGELVQKVPRKSCQTHKEGKFARLQISLTGVLW